MEDLEKVIKKQRKRLSARKREIRERVKEEHLALVRARIRSFLEYLGRWCDGHREEGEEEKAEDGEGI